MTDEYLCVQAAKEGDTAAFEQLVCAYEKPAYALALRICQKPEYAAEATQEAFLALWRGLSSFRGDAKFSTWLCSIVFNACRASRRRRRAFSVFADRLAVMAGLMRAPDGRDLYDGAWIRSAISRLKPDLRDTAILVAGQQLTHAEAAEILGIAEATVSWRMHEVRRLLDARTETAD